MLQNLNKIVLKMKKILCGVLAKKALLKKNHNNVPMCIIEGKDVYKEF